MKSATTGTTSRAGHALRDALMTFDLPREVERLRSEPEWLERDRTSITLAKQPTFRMLLSVLHDGAEIGHEEAEGPVAIQVLEGSLVVAADGSAMTLAAGSLATLDTRRRWAFRAQGDAAALLTISWPEGEAGDHQGDAF